MARTHTRITAEKRREPAAADASLPVVFPPAKSALLLAGIIVIVFGLYANALGGTFVYDDHALVSTYDLVKDIRNIPKAFVSPTNLYGNTNYYRPLQTISYMVDHFLWGDDTFGYHLTNVICHAAAVIALFLFIAGLFRNAPLGLLAAFLFGIHPVHSSVVAYVSGRADAMLAVFFLGALAFYIKAAYGERRRAAALVVSNLFFLLALLTKETALFLPVICILFDMVLRRLTPVGAKKAGPFIYLPYFIITALYLLFRANRMSFYVPGAIAPFPFANRLITAPYALVEYLRLIVVPNDLHIERLPWVGRSLFEEKILFSWLAFGAVAAGLFFLRKRMQPVVFGMLLFAFLIVPSLNIITPLFAVIAENWLYLPSVGIFLAIAAGIVYWYGKAGATTFAKACVTLAVLAYAVPMAALTVSHNAAWKDEIALGENTVRFNPYAFKVYNNLGVAYLGKGDLDRAEANFRRCLAIKPDTGMAYFNLYRVMMGKGRRGEADAFLRKALELDPSGVGIVIDRLGIPRPR